MVIEVFGVELVPGLHAERNSASGRKGATRYSIYRSTGTWVGDFVRFLPEGTYSWQPERGRDDEGTDAAAILRRNRVGREEVDYEREGTDEPCDRGTVGCSVKHSCDSDCETW